MKCPCGCGEEVPNGCFWAKKKVCSRRGIKKGIRMPIKRSEFERSLHDKRTLKWKANHG